MFKFIDKHKYKRTFFFLSLEKQSKKIKHNI